MPAPPAITKAPVSVLVDDAVLYVDIISSVVTSVVVTVVYWIVNRSAIISPVTVKLPVTVAVLRFAVPRTVSPTTSKFP